MNILSSATLSLAFAFVAICGETIAQDGTAKPQKKPAKMIPGEFDRAKAAKESRAAIERFVKAWNSAENPTFRKALHFPFVTIGVDGTIVVEQKPEDHTTDFEKLIARGRWDHSTFDKIELITLLPNKAHYKVNFSRRNKAGEAYGTGEIIYIASKREGRWAVCTRSILGWVRK
jgi:hypothetical protein